MDTPLNEVQGTWVLYGTKAVQYSKADQSSNGDVADYIAPVVQENLTGIVYHPVEEGGNNGVATEQDSKTNQVFLCVVRRRGGGG